MGLLEALLGRSTGAPAAIGDSESFVVCSSAGCNTFTITLVDVVYNGDGTVTVTVDQDGGDKDLNAVPTVTLTITITTGFGDVVIFEDTSEWFPGSHRTHIGTGTGAVDDPVTVTATTDSFGGGTAQVGGTVPFNPDLVDIVDGSGEMSPNPADVDEPVTFSVRVSNENTVGASVDYTVLEPTTGFRWAGLTNATIPADDTVELTASAVPQDIGKGPGDYDLEAQATDAIEEAFNLTNVSRAAP